MKWSDKPLYEKNMTSEPQEAPQEYWERTTFKGFARKAASPAPLVLWYLEEDRKRANAEPNEHDYYNIRAALKGVRNRWYDFAQRHPEFMDIPLKKMDWNLINAERPK